MTREVLFVLLALLTLAGAAGVVLQRDVTRFALSFGLFLLGIAGFFGYYGFAFLALAEVFVYVGGVLVLVLFALMLVHRQTPGSPSMSSRHTLMSTVASLGITLMLAVLLAPAAPLVTGVARGTGVDGSGARLLGAMLPQFELAGLLLLTALVAVVAISGRGSE